MPKAQEPQQGEQGKGREITLVAAVESQPALLSSNLPLEMNFQCVHHQASPAEALRWGS